MGAPITGGALNMDSIKNGVDTQSEHPGNTGKIGKPAFAYLGKISRIPGRAACILLDIFSQILTSYLAQLNWQARGGFRERSVGVSTPSAHT